jgi:hypothetical protein
MDLALLCCLKMTLSLDVSLNSVNSNYILACGIESIRIPIFGMLYVNIGLALASAAMM